MAVSLPHDWRAPKSGVTTLIMLRMDGCNSCHQYEPVFREASQTLASPTVEMFICNVSETRVVLDLAETQGLIIKTTPTTVRIGPDGKWTSYSGLMIIERLLQFATGADSQGSDSVAKKLRPTTKLATRIEAAHSAALEKVQQCTNAYPPQHGLPIILFRSLPQDTAEEAANADIGYVTKFFGGDALCQMFIWIDLSRVSIQYDRSPTPAIIFPDNTRHYGKSAILKALDVARSTHYKN